MSTEAVAGYAASFAQTGIWLNERLGTAGTTYHLPLTIRFEGPIDTAALEQAVSGLFERHPLLATSVEERDGVPYLVPSHTTPVLRIADVPDGAPLEQLIREEVVRPFDLREELARITMVRVGPDRSVLLFVAHHLAFDGESKGVFVRDLGALYTAAVTGHASQLPDIPASDAVPEPDPEPARRYWEEHYRAPAEVILPGTVGSRQQADRGVIHRFDLDAATHNSLDALASKLGASRFELFLGVLATLLLRYGNEQATVAIDLTTRTTQTRDRIGVFVNELPLTVAPKADSSYAQLIARLRSDLRELYRYRDIPLARAVSGLPPATALAPVLLSYSFRSERADFAGVAGAVDWVASSHASRNVLRVQIVDTPTSATISLQGSSQLLDDDDLARISGHLQTLLASVAADPESGFSDLEFIPPAELARLEQHAQGPVPRPARGTLPQLVTEHAAATPDRIAVVDGDRQLSYSELDRLSDRLAHRLAAAGAGPGRLVAVCAEPSREFVAGLLGVMKTGAAYLPLDPAYPAERLAYIVDDARPAVILTDRNSTARLPEGAAVVTLDERADGPGQLFGAALDGLAYVIYTSGSTGRPKGVEVGHGALMNLIDAMAVELDSTSEDVWLAATSPQFDISALEMFLPLATGGRLVVAPGGSGRDGDALVRLVRDAEVSHVQATPSGWRILLAAGFDEPGVDALVGGEALPTHLAQELRGRVRRLWNVYGPTETTIWSTISEVQPGSSTVSIGRPIAATRTYVLDDTLRPRPFGVPGELYIGGAGLARGYLGRPELTRERFVPDPRGWPGERLYRTGDRVRLEADGTLSFLGRVDQQIKLRGHRIEPGEIEAALLRHHAVREALVALRSDDEDNPLLVGYITAEQDPGPDVGELREHLARTLPAAMVPARFVTLERFPLTPNGKLDRAALPAPGRMPAPTPTRPPTPGSRAAGQDDDGVTDVTDLTDQIREIWQEVLGVADIGPDEDLFDLGGHSLTITRINARIHQRLGVRLPLDFLFEHPTIAETVATVRTRAANPGAR
ncbi:MAG: amino acid adenylation domain-containing protein [Catenulispora sp.]|nr:amino acid adenylation domain-containing protein [Catenulispora sp.]